MRLKPQIWIVGLVGLGLPFLARIPGSIADGGAWAAQYIQAGTLGFLFVELFNLPAVGVAIGLAARYHRRMLWLLPVAPGYGFLWFAHSSLDLAADAQAAVALFFIPIYALPFFAPGALLAELLHRWSGQRRNRQS